MIPPLPDGLQERTRHFRVYQGGFMPESSLRAMGLMGKVEPRGGRTYVEIFEPGSGDLVARGIARCNPKETYSKRMGRMIARGKALAELDGRAQTRRDRREAETAREAELERLRGIDDRQRDRLAKARA